MSELRKAVERARKANGLPPSYENAPPSFPPEMGALMTSEAKEYFQCCVPREGFTVFQVTLDSADEIEGQFGHGAPRIAPFGFVRIATHEGLPCFILDAFTGRVYYTSLDEYAPALYELEEQEISRQHILEAISEYSYDTCDDLMGFFKYIQDL